MFFYSRNDTFVNEHMICKMRQTYLHTIIGPSPFFHLHAFNVLLDEIKMGKFISLYHVSGYFTQRTFYLQAFEIVLIVEVTKFSIIPFSQYAYIYIHLCFVSTILFFFIRIDNKSTCKFKCFVYIEHKTQPYSQSYHQLVPSRFILIRTIC